MNRAYKNIIADLKKRLHKGGERVKFAHWVQIDERIMLVEKDERFINSCRLMIYLNKVGPRW